MPDERERENWDELDKESINRRQGQNRRPMVRGGRMVTEKIKPKNAKSVLRRLGAYLASKTSLMALAVAFSLMSTLITIVGTRRIGVAIDEYVAKGNLSGLASQAMILAGLYLLGFLLTLFQARIMIRVSQDTTVRLRQDLFEKQARLPVKYFDTHPSGDLMSRLTNDIDQISMALSQNLMSFFNGLISLVGIVVAMLLLSPLLTLIFFVMIPVMMLATMILSRYTRKMYGRQQRVLGELNGYVEETVSGQKAVLLFGRQEKAQEKFDEINGRLEQSGIKTFIGTGMLMPVMSLINNVIFLLLAVVGGYLIVQGRMTPGIVLSFLLYMRNVTRPLNELANMFTMMQGALAGAERVFELMDEEKEQDAPGAGELGGVEGFVSMEHADFSYISGKPVIVDSSLEAEPGKMTALVGPTGAGKTTLISLLARFYDLDHGRISIDGQDLSTVTRDSVRKNMGIVLQDTFLFSETVRDNIRYGKPEATQEEVEEAAKLAGVHGFIARMPEGYDTILKDNGENFSQGQRQLLSIARVILAQPSLLILDEATSSVDTGTEIRIQQALMKLMQGRTSFVIAHRLSTIRHADQILVINNGQIVERGNHRELLTMDGFYANLYNSQFRTGLVE